MDEALLASASANCTGSGTMPSMPTTSCGEVPQVTVGLMSSALTTTSSSYFASGSLTRVRQYSTAVSNKPPSTEGPMGRPLRYLYVMSSGATMPALAPASMAMLQMDILASIDMAAMHFPANSMTWPVPPAVPITPMMCRITSLEVTPKPSSPSTKTRMFFALDCTSVCVANTCSTSLVPIPKARAPNAPCVAVCESPHTMVVPGKVKPCSGPIICTIPCLLSSMPK
mmetsp:Transcript_27314/g.37638  ORF Transcript_27314/g.37638 Transcript_27314/m.37638 type:complete len:227 (-) Transcript_27314:458-1138(-)